MGGVLAAHSRLADLGSAFRSALTGEDVREMHSAKRIFLSNSFIPAVIYYLGFGIDGKSKTKFPATISWTIRGGLPKYVHFVLWSYAWSKFFRVLVRVAKVTGDSFIKKFAAQMYATGVAVTMISSVGKSEFHDKIHFVGAFLYMIDHHILFQYLNTAWFYRAVFYASLIMMGRQIGKVKAMGIPPMLLEQSNWKEIRKSFGASIAKRVYRREALIMLFENAMFIAFVSGITSRLPSEEEANRKLRERAEKH